MSGKHKTTRSVLRGFRRDNTIAAAFAGLDKPAKEETAIQELSNIYPIAIQELLQQALDALESMESLVDSYYIPRGKQYTPECEAAILAIRKALDAGKNKI